MDLAVCPDERPRGFIVAGDECVDVGDEFWNALEGRAVERFAGQDREPDFNLVEPGGMCRGVMKPHVSVSLQPCRVWAYGWRDYRGRHGFHALDERRRHG